MTVKLLTEHYLEILRLKGGCTGSSESTHVKIATLLEITCRGSIIIVLRNTIRLSSSLKSMFVERYLGPSCLQRLSTGNKLPLNPEGYNPILTIFLFMKILFAHIASAALK